MKPESPKTVTVPVIPEPLTCVGRSQRPRRLRGLRMYTKPGMKLTASIDRLFLAASHFRRHPPLDSHARHSAWPLLQFTCTEATSRGELGRASCRERVGQSGYKSGVVGYLKKKKKNR